jgi:hypothetical protein
MSNAEQPARGPEDVTGIAPDVVDVGQGTLPVDGVSQFIDPLAEDPVEMGLQPSKAQVVGAAGLLAVALRDTNVTPEAVEEMFSSPTGAQTPVRELIDQMLEEEDDLRPLVQDRVLRMRGMSPAAQLEALRELEGPVFDVNVAERKVAEAAAIAEAVASDEEDADEWAQVAQDRVESIPRALTPWDPAMGTPEEQQEAVWESLRAMREQAEESLGVLDFVEQITPVGSLPTLNAVVDQINLAMGFTGDYSKPQSYARVGEALRNLRNYYRQAPQAERTRMAKVVLNELKGNTGLFQDSNDLVVLHVLDNLFSEVLTGADQYTQEIEPTEAERKQLEARLEAISEERAALQYGPGYSQKKRALIRERNRIHARLESMTSSQFMDDILNALDLTGLGSVAGGTIRFGTKYVPAAWRRMFSAAPETAGRRVADAVENPEVAKQMGMTPANAVEQGLPNTGRVERGANVLTELELRQRDALEVLQRQRRSVNLTEAERAAALQEIADDIDILTSKRLPKTHVNLSSVTARADGTGADIEVVFGATAQRGYSTLGGAQRAQLTAVEEVFGAGAKPEIVEWDAAANAFRAVPEGTSPKTSGEYFLRVQDSRSYASARQTWGALQLGDDAVADLQLGASVSRWTRGLNVFDRLTQAFVSARARQARSAQAIGLGLIKPLADLPFEKKQLLAAIVKKNEGRVLTRAELGAQGADDSVIEAYNAFRAVDDGIYDTLDELLRTDKLRNGMQELRVNGVRAGFVKPYERLAALGQDSPKVFDPETGLVKTMSRDELAQLYDKGGQIGRLEYPVNGPQGLARHVLLSGKNSKLLPVPMRGVLPRIPGHYPHTSQGAYVVYGVRNGERVALKLAATETDAAEYVARRSALMAQRASRGKGSRFERIGYELDGSLQQPEAFAKKLDEMIVNRGGILFGQRSGGRLGNLSPDFGAIELDPIAALLQGWDVATQSVTKGELVSTMKKRLHNFLRLPENKNLFVGGDTPAERLSMQNINTTFSSVRARDTAVAYMKQIELMEATPDGWRNATRAVYQRMAHAAFKLGQKPFVAKLGLKGATRRIEEATLSASRRSANVVSAYMSLMHAMYIAIPAIRQFVMNVAQTSVASAMFPAQAAKSWRQFPGIASAVYGRISWLHGGKQVFTDAMLRQYAQGMSKVTGLSVDEVVGLTDTIVESGLIDAVSHNTMIREAVGEAAAKAMTAKASATTGALGAAGRAAARVGEAVRWPVNQLSRIGFQAGENVNQIVSFLHLYNADKAAGLADLTSSLYRDQLVGRAAELTGNMIAEAAPEYTRSMVKPLFQWLQFSHKMMLLGLPKSIGGSSMFSGVEKARMVFMQYLLFGAQASAVTAVLHKLIEDRVVEKIELTEDGDANAFVQAWRSDLGVQFMDGIVFDYSANKVAQALFGEADEKWEDFRWSKTFAPGSGHDALSERIIGMFSLDPQAVLGVQVKTASNLWNYGSLVADVTLARFRDMDDAPFEQRAEQLVKRGGALLIAPYGKWLAARWATDHDMRLASGGRVAEAYTNDFEAAISVAIGVETKDRLAYYEARKAIEGSGAGAARKDRVQELADIYWQQLVDNSTKFSAQAPSDDIYDELLKNYINDQGLILSALDRRDKEAITEIIDAKLQRVASGDGTTAEQAFVERITRKLANGGFGGEGPKVANYLRHLPFVKDDPAMSILVEDAWREVMEEPEPQNMTTNETTYGN